ncbi:MAG: hypothetical protein QOF00_3797, partial [Pseudonocardiales bacterium]|nr:hypothetical protein [Pseudonocardiales bacterium]
MAQIVDPSIAGKGGTARGFRKWAAAESIEDYSLRYTPTTFRRWTPLIVASTGARVSATSTRPS